MVSNGCYILTFFLPLPHLIRWTLLAHRTNAPTPRAEPPVTLCMPSPAKHN